METKQLASQMGARRRAQMRGAELLVALLAGLVATTSLEHAKHDPRGANHRLRTKRPQKFDVTSMCSHAHVLTLTWAQSTTVPLRDQ